MNIPVAMIGYPRAKPGVYQGGECDDRYLIATLKTGPN